MALYLSFKEIWRNKGRFLLFSMVIALITVLVLFIAGLAEGLATANKEYLDKMDADLLVFQENTKLSTTASRLGRNTLMDVRRLDTVAAVGPVGFSSVTIVEPALKTPLDVALIGVEPGRPGAPDITGGRNLLSRRAEEAVIDASVAERAGVKIGDTIKIKSIQGTDEEFYTLRVIGVTESRQYFFQPAVFVPFPTWESIRPQAAAPNANTEWIANILAVQLRNPADWKAEAGNIAGRVNGIEVVDRKTAYEASPGYAAQQSTLNTQQVFTLLIGVLVIGGFFQIQTLQKIPQIGMLKAVGASNRTVAVAVILQIILVTVFGVTLGGLATLGLSFGLPGTVPIIFVGNSVLLAIVALLLIGPVGGMVSVRLALKVDPLTALGM